MSSNRRAKNLLETGPMQGTPWTSVGPGSLIKGDLLMSGNVLVYGRIEGILFTDGDVWLAPGAHVDGGIHGTRVIIEGVCHGRIEALEAVSLRAGSEVRAEVATPLLDVEDDARFWGRRVATGKSGPEAKPYQSRSLGNA